MGDRKLNHRIPVYEETRDRLRDFAYGGGGVYDDVLNYMLDAMKQEGESDLEAGLRLRASIRAYVERHSRVS